MPWKGYAEVNIWKGTSPNPLTGSPLGHLGIFPKPVVQEPLQAVRTLEFVVRRRDDLDTGFVQRWDDPLCDDLQDGREALLNLFGDESFA